MRVHLQDFSGHPFQAQLSRRLAGRGHDVAHSWCAQYVSGHGRLTAEPDDPSTLTFRPLAADVPLERYSPLGRARFERSYGRVLGNVLVHDRPDVVVICNVPLFAHAHVARMLANAGIPWVFWHQDVYSAGVAAEAGRRLPAFAASGVARYATRVEKRLVRRATAVIAIGEPFVDRYREWGLPTAHTTVIPNWAPLDDIVPRPRDNGWWPLGDPGRRLLYAGTLGRKHNPQLLVDLLDAVRVREAAAQLVVASEGAGADELRNAGYAERTDLALVPFQPASLLPDMLSSADVLVAILEPDAAAFSIPSKVLSYLAAGRPVVVLAPGSNPSAADVRTAGGLVVEPDAAGVADAAAWIADLTPERIAQIGTQARAFAEERFDIETITDRFEAVLRNAAGPKVAHR